MNKQNNKFKFDVIVKHTGEDVEQFETAQQAKDFIKQLETKQVADGTYTPNYYAVINLNSLNENLLTKSSVISQMGYYKDELESGEITSLETGNLPDGSISRKFKCAYAEVEENECIDITLYCYNEGQEEKHFHADYYENIFDITVFIENLFEKLSYGCKFEFEYKRMINNITDFLRKSLIPQINIEKVSVKSQNLIPLSNWADLNGIANSTARQRAARGTIPAVKVGRDWFIDENAKNIDTRIKSGKYINFRKKDK